MTPYSPDARLVSHKPDIHLADATHRAILLLLRALAAQRDMESPQPVNLHLITLRKRQAQLLHKSLDSVLHISQAVSEEFASIASASLLSSITLTVPDFWQLHNTTPAIFLIHILSAL